MPPSFFFALVAAAYLIACHDSWITKPIGYQRVPREQPSPLGVDINTAESLPCVGAKLQFSGQRRSPHQIAQFHRIKLSEHATWQLHGRHPSKAAAAAEHFDIESTARQCTPIAAIASGAKGRRDLRLL